MDYNLALKALEKVEPYLDAEEHDALGWFIALFEPYDGDDPDEARQRDHAKGHCANCGFEAPLIFFPAPIEQVATAALRLAQCPRCFCTKMMCGTAKK